MGSFKINKCDIWCLQTSLMSNREQQAWQQPKEFIFIIIIIIRFILWHQLAGQERLVRVWLCLLRPAAPTPSTLWTTRTCVSCGTGPSTTWPSPAAAPSSTTTPSCACRRSRGWRRWRGPRSATRRTTSPCATTGTRPPVRIQLLALLALLARPPGL